MRFFSERRMKYFQKAKKYVIMGVNDLQDLRQFSDYTQFISETPFDFSKNSSIGVGGKADIVFYPRSTAECALLIKMLQREGVEYCVLGNLTNVLPPDEGSSRVIIRTNKLNGVLVTDNGVFAYAGATSGALLASCKRAGKSGLEFLKGVPCTLGGALYMNAGAGGVYMDSVVESVLVYREGETKILPVQDCAYAYKSSAFMRSQDVILGASLRLKKASIEEIEEKERFFAQRRAHLPKGKSMGCTFKNPHNAFAGDLIERSGLKGFRIGGARVSQDHANFIVNDGNATAKDIRELILVIKNAVLAQYGVKLEEEIRYLT